MLGRRGATAGLIFRCTNVTSDHATALAWQMMAAANLGGVGGNVRQHLWREEVKKVRVAKPTSNVGFMKVINHFKTFTCLDEV